MKAATACAPPPCSPIPRSRTETRAQARGWRVVSRRISPSPSGSRSKILSAIHDGVKSSPILTHAGQSPDQAPGRLWRRWNGALYWAPPQRQRMAQSHFGVRTAHCPRSYISLQQIVEIRIRCDNAQRRLSRTRASRAPRRDKACPLRRFRRLAGLRRRFVVVPRWIPAFAGMAGVSATLDASSRKIYR